MGKSDKGIPATQAEIEQHFRMQHEMDLRFEQATLLAPGMGDRLLQVASRPTSSPLLTAESSLSPKNKTALMNELKAELNALNPMNLTGTRGLKSLANAPAGNLEAFEGRQTPNWTPFNAFGVPISGGPIGGNVGGMSDKRRDTRKDAVKAINDQRTRLRKARSRSANITLQSERGRGRTIGTILGGGRSLGSTALLGR
jgi:hypothetical protein